MKIARFMESLIMFKYRSASFIIAICDSVSYFSIDRPS